MKTNINVAGNNLSAGSNLRLNDLTLPLPSPLPAAQIQEVDPAGVLPSSADRTAADTALTGVAPAGNRLASRSTLALLTSGTRTFRIYAHLVTILSRDDDTTARGWQRLDLTRLSVPRPTMRRKWRLRPASPTGSVTPGPGRHWQNSRAIRCSTIADCGSRSPRTSSIISTPMTSRPTWRLFLPAILMPCRCLASKRFPISWQSR